MYLAAYCDVMFSGIDMYKTITIVLKLIFLIISLNASADTGYYEYDFINKKNKHEITLSLSNLNVNKYPGWKHSRDRTANVSIWFPSLVETSEPNVWISNKEEQNKAKIKPNENDRKINLTLGNIGPNNIMDPNGIIKGEPIFECKKKQSFEKFVEDGKVGVFDHYKNIKRKPSSQEIHLYLLTKPAKGVGCIKCNGATCQLFGVSNIGIKYVATEQYIESKMLQEALAIHEGINQFIESKRVND